jgi:malate dehydrogenase (oxaloacetate-decarboxylating)
MFMAAVRALAKMSPAQANPNANLLPPVTSLRDVSAAVALAVARQAHNEGLTEGINTDEIEGSIRAKIWAPRYLPYRRIDKP